MCFETDGDGWITMGKDGQLNLVNLPWPLSILKCNQQMVEMVPGERLDVTVKENATKENLVILLKKMREYEFDIGFSHGRYRLSIKKRQASRSNAIT